MALSAGYTGPGNVVAFDAWWGLRAYSAAYATSLGPAIDIVSAVPNTDADTLNVSADGTLNTAVLVNSGTSLATWIAAHGTPLVIKAYDQSGNGKDFINTTTPPPLVASPLGIQPAGAGQCLVHALISISQPYLICGVGLSTAGTNDSSTFWGGAPANDVRGTMRTTNQFGIFAGGTDISCLTPFSLNALHAFSGVYNGLSSLVNVDNGSDTNAGGISPGTTAVTNLTFLAESTTGTNILQGYMKEGGIISATSTTNVALLANMKTAWGIT